MIFSLLILLVVGVMWWDLSKGQEIIMATQTQLAADLRAVLAQQQKTSTEIATVQTSVNTLKDKITELEGIISSGGEASQELTDAVAAVKAQAQVVDDQIPDPIVTPPVEPPVEPPV